MSTSHPIGGQPLVFSASLPRNSLDTEKAPIEAQNETTFNAVESEGDQPSMTLALVAFDYPDGNGAGDFPDLPPLVEVKTGDGPWQLIFNTGGLGAKTLTLGDPVHNQLIDYTCSSPDANMVTTIVFLRNNAAFGGQTWSIRFTFNDGKTSPDDQRAVTFAIDELSAGAPWIVVPSQTENGGRAAIDFGQATTHGVGVLGTTPAPPVTLSFGSPFVVVVGMANYGTRALTVTGVNVIAAQGATAALIPGAVTIPPGSRGAAVKATVTGIMPPSGGLLSAPFVFSIESDDPLAGDQGGNAHNNVVTFSVLMHFTLPTPIDG